MIAAYLETYDFNLPLIDAINDPDLNDRRSQLAALSLGENLDAGYYIAQELADLMLGIARAENAVRPQGPDGLRLAELIGPFGDAQAVALYDAVADLPAADAASHLGWLAALLKVRAGMYRAIATTDAAMPPLPGT